jgi:hypothetical protein
MYKPFPKQKIKINSKSIQTDPIGQYSILIPNKIWKKEKNDSK